MSARPISVSPHSFIKSTACNAPGCEAMLLKILPNIHPEPSRKGLDDQAGSKTLVTPSYRKCHPTAIRRSARSPGTSLFRKSIEIISCYLPEALSSRLRIEKMKAAEARQQTMNTSHNCHSSTLSHSRVPTNRSLLPTAVASSQPPCIRP